MKIKAILTGATGMVGEGVLHECLLHDDVEEVLVIGRRNCGINHPKLKEIIVPNFFDLSSLGNQVSGYNACFFCLGVSSIGTKRLAFPGKAFPCLPDGPILVSVGGALKGKARA